MAAPVARDTNGGVTTNTNPFVVPNLNTTQTDYILYLSVWTEHTGTAAPTVTSITSAGMTWALRKRSNSSITGCLETWWAHGTGALSGYNISINLSGAYDNGAACVVVVTGCANPAAPFDTNAGLPAALSAPTVSAWTPSFTGISTSSSDDLLLFSIGSPSGGGTPPSGFTLLQHRATGGGSWAAVQDMTSQGVTALQSGATFTYGSSLSNPFSGSATAGEAIFDALAGNLPAGSGAQARVMVLA